MTGTGTKRTPLVTNEANYNTWKTEIETYIANGGTLADDFATYSAVVTTTMSSAIYTEMIESINNDSDYNTYVARVDIYDPYCVDTIADFRTACAKIDAYVKLTADLDCNKEKYLSWSTLTSNAIEVDFNGYAIKTPYIATGEGMINGQNKTILKNGSILNIYEESALYILRNCSLYNMSISANLYRVTDIPFGYLNNVEKCNFKIFNQNINEHKAWFTKRLVTSKQSEISFKDTYFYLEGKVSPHSYGCLIGTNAATTSNSNYGMMDGCRIEGVLDATSITRNSIYISYGIIKNCIFAIDVTPFVKTQEGVSTPYFINGHGNNVNNLYQSDKAQGAGCYGTICTAEQIRDPDHLNSIGFFVSEVTP